MAEYLSKTTDFLKSSPSQLIDGAKSGNWGYILIVIVLIIKQNPSDWRGFSFLKSYTIQDKLFQKLSLR
jgi:hypothetical protein